MENDVSKEIFLNQLKLIHNKHTELFDILFNNEEYANLLEEYNVALIDSKPTYYVDSFAKFYVLIFQDINFDKKILYKAETIRKWNDENLQKFPPIKKHNKMKRILCALSSTLNCNIFNISTLNDFEAELIKIIDSKKSNLNDLHVTTTENDLYNNLYTMNDYKKNLECGDILLEYTDKVLNENFAKLITTKVMTPLSLEFNTIQFQHWQDFEGEIKIIKISIYGSKSAKLYEYDLNIKTHDRNNIAIECNLTEQLLMIEPLIFTIEIKAENYFTNLFSVNGTKVSINEYRMRYPVKSFKYHFICPNEMDFLINAKYKTISKLTSTSSDIESEYIFYVENLLADDLVEIDIKRL